VPYLQSAYPIKPAFVRTLLAKEYHTGRASLPGNDDAGTMSSWYVWSSIGLYPLAGQPIYFIGSPIFRQRHNPSWNRQGLLGSVCQ
jgi:putative alpha-1,2-mannosidase